MKKNALASLAAIVVALVANTACGLVPTPDTKGQPGDGNGDNTVKLTGDVWVDAKGDAIGLSRTVTTLTNDSADGLVDVNNVTWRVSTDRQSVGPLDDNGGIFFDSTDCSGTGKIASRDNTELRLGNAIEMVGGTQEFVFTIPSTAKLAAGDFQSWDDPIYGCLNFTSGIYDNKPSQFYAVADVTKIDAPAFSPPLAVERR